MKGRRWLRGSGGNGQLLIRACLSLLAALIAASLGDAMQINEGVRRAAEAMLPSREAMRQWGNRSSGYAAVLQQQRIGGARNPQGLTYQVDSRTLLTVLENEQAIVELDLCGKLLRRIGIIAPYPLEEVTALSDGYVLLSFANTSTVVLIALPEQAISVDIKAGIELEFRDGNLVLESEEIAWDASQQHLYLASKDYPPRIHRAPFPLVQLRQRSRGRHQLSASSWLETDRIQPLMPEITALAYAAARGQLLLLSDETRTILAVDEDRRPRPYLRLERGIAGLQARIRSPEGMAVAQDASLYLISDSAAAYLYRFFPEPELTRQSTCPVR